MQLGQYVKILLFTTGARILEINQVAMLFTQAHRIRQRARSKRSVSQSMFSGLGDA